MELFDTHLNLDDTPMTQDELTAAVQRCDILVPTVTDNIDAGVIGEAGLDLKLMANFGVGVNHIDLKAAEARGIQVSNTPDVLTEDTADLAMALILMTSRRLGEGERMIRAGAWTGWTPTQLMGHRVAGKRLGIIGMGRIGRAVARVPGASASPFIIIIAIACMKTWKPALKPPTGKIWIRCYGIWISSQSIRHTRPQR